MRYKVELIESEEGYAVGCPELPGCWTQGRTKEEAISKIRGAIQEYRSVLQGNNRATVLFVEVPEESTVKAGSSSSSEHKNFEVKPFPMGMPPGGSYDKVEELLDLLEGPYRR